MGEGLAASPGHGSFRIASWGWRLGREYWKLLSLTEIGSVYSGFMLCCPGYNEKQPVMAQEQRGPRHRFSVLGYFGILSGRASWDGTLLPRWALSCSLSSAGGCKCPCVWEGRCPKLAGDPIQPFSAVLVELVLFPLLHLNWAFLVCCWQ